jgi:hypothetical protein
LVYSQKKKWTSLNAASSGRKKMLDFYMNFTRKSRNLYEILGNYKKFGGEFAKF